MTAFLWLTSLFKKKPNNNFSKKIEIKNREFIFRESERNDAKDMVRIERLVYDGLVPWNEQAFVWEMKHKQGGLYLSVLYNGEIVGFAGSNLIKKKDLHVTNIAVQPDFQSNKIGSVLIDELIDFAISKKAKKISLEVRFSNVLAQEFYYKKGFQIVRQIPGYYNGDHETAVYMEREIVGN
jgi:ribosomal-protein-alanine N-acetyltransferase